MKRFSTLLLTAAGLLWFASAGARANWVVDYTYNARGLAVSSPGYVRSVEYDLQGRITRMVYQNGVENRTDFDALTGLPQRLRILGPAGQIYVGLSDNLVVQANGTANMTIVAGTTAPPLLDGQPATLAPLGLDSGFAGLALDAAGNLLVADAGLNALRKVSPDGMIHTVIQRLPQLTGVATVPGSIYFGWSGMVEDDGGRQREAGGFGEPVAELEGGEGVEAQVT